MAVGRRRGRYLLKFFLILTLAGATLAVWGFAIEPGRLVTCEATVQSAWWSAGRAPLRIVAISDIHTGSPHNGLDNLARVVDRANALAPDIVVLLGDYVIHGVLFGRFVAPEATARVLGRWRARHGIFAVLGNHDWWLDGMRVGNALRRAGIRVLENQATPLDLPGGRIWLAGIADDTTRMPNVVGTLAPIPDADPVIVITHDPAIFPDVPVRPVMTLAGHMHGGQVYLPWIGALIVPGRAPRRHAHGLIEEGGKTMYVTSGVGTSIIPVRLNMPPEIAAITIRPSSTPKRSATK